MRNWEKIARVVALSLLMIFSVAAVLPLIHSSAQTTEQAHASGRRRPPAKMRRYSRAWWRRYRARLKRRQAALKRKRELAAAASRQSNGWPSGVSSPDMSQNVPPQLMASATVGNDPRTQAAAPLPVANGHGLRPDATLAAGLNKGVRLIGTDGRSVGEVSVSVVAGASARSLTGLPASQRRALGGVPFTALRRTVIDKMLAAGGWVVNDFERQINGRRVYVVLAQTSSPGDRRVAEQAWLFYFTEVEGRIYNIVSNSPLEFSDRMALEAEKVLATLGPLNRTNDTEASRR